MGFVSVYYCGFYLVLAAYNRYFNSMAENIEKGTLKKDLNSWKQKKQDDLGRFINELADQKSLPPNDDQSSNQNDTDSVAYRRRGLNNS